MAKKVFPVKLEPETIVKLKRRGKKAVKEKEYASTNAMCEAALTQLANS